LIHSNAFAQDYHMTYDNGLITLSADKTDIQDILSGISKKTNVFIQFPRALKEQITIRLTNVSVRDALSRLLKGRDYAIIYSASKKSNRNPLSKVYVLPEQWGSRKPARSQTRSRQVKRIERSLRNYKKRLDSLKNRLSKVGQGTLKERRIMRQIRLTEKTVGRLEKRLRR